MEAGGHTPVPGTAFLHCLASAHHGMLTPALVEPEVHVLRGEVTTSLFCFFILDR